MDSKSYEISKSAPVRSGTQAPGKHLIHTGANRAQRRAEAAVKAKPLPKSISLITALRAGSHHFLDTPVYRISISRRGLTDVMTVYSKEGAAPIVGGLLERMTRPGGGEAAIWTDARASKESIGGGYTRLAVPAELGFPGGRAGSGADRVAVREPDAGRAVAGRAAMSTHLQWKPFRPVGERITDDVTLKGILHKRYGHVINRRFTAADVEYLEGLRDGGVPGASVLVRAIEEHDEIIVEETE